MKKIIIRCPRCNSVTKALKDENGNNVYFCNNGKCEKTKITITK